MNDEFYMRRCLQLASLGLGTVSPNPMVGAVLVRDEKIIGEGYHHQYGHEHAEIDAINSVFDKKLLKSATLYVNLEPCSHFGKQPPCADAIIRYEIPKVVVGIVDCNEKVNGNGIEKLRNAGVEVVENVCKDECEFLNRRFFTFHRQKRPYIILKWAQTANGFMDIDRRSENVENYWITNKALKVLVHKWRSEEDAVLVGFNTLINDKPQLTVREYVGRNPKRLVMCRAESSAEENSDFICLPDSAEAAVEMMYNAGIQSVIVEGGRKTLDKFIAADLWDEARILTGEQFWKSGLPSPQIRGIVEKTVKIDKNILQYVRRYV